MLRQSAFFLSVALCAFVVASTAHEANAQPGAAALPGAAASKGAARALITRAVDDTDRVTLHANTRPEAVAASDRGAIADNTALDHMLLVLRRPPEREQALVQLIDQMHDRKSPNFHRWLKAAEFGERFGPSAADVQAVTNWLASRGFQVNTVYPNRMMIDFSGTAGRVREGFRTEIHQFDVGGKRHIANVSDPQIPAALAPAVVGIVSLHDFRPHANSKIKVRSNFTASTGYFALVPADLATIYNFNPLFTGGTTGTGQTVVVIEDTDMYSTADWDTFRSTFGLSTYTSGSLSQVHPAPPSGVNNCGAPGVLTGNDSEAALDAEWASAAAPNAAIVVAACRDTKTTFGGLIALQNLINAASHPFIFSVSYGLCETFNGAAANQAYYNTYQQAAAQGVSVFVSSGDEGAAGCDRASAATHGIGVNAFASTPYNVAVGGTDFSDFYSGTTSTYWSPTNTAVYGSALSYIPEFPWDDSCANVPLATYVSGSPVTYGKNGFCNSSTGKQFYLTTTAGGGGPSGCATGKTKSRGVVSGTCQGWPKPSWQSGFAGIVNDDVRDIPDVSLFAANGLWSHYYVFCYTNPAGGGVPCTGNPANWVGAGGTSFGAPIWAGIQALVNQSVGSPQGNPNPVFYALAAAEYGAGGSATCNSNNGPVGTSACIFYDVTFGDIDVNCTGKFNCYRPSGTNGVLSTDSKSYKPAYGTTTGWDFSTGIGTVNVTNLVNGWPP